MVTGTYRDLFVATATAAASLTGLLFVALSVAPRPRPGEHTAVIRQIRAAAALMAFTSTLAVSLFGLVPGNEIGYPATVVGVGGVLFTLGGVRSIVSDPGARQRIGSQIGLIALLLAAFGGELVAGAAALAHPHSTGPVQWIGNILAATLLLGVARSWELVGDRDTGVMSSILALAGHERHLGGSVACRLMFPPRLLLARRLIRTARPAREAAHPHGTAGSPEAADPHGTAGSPDASPADAADPGGPAGRAG